MGNVDPYADYLLIVYPEGRSSFAATQAFSAYAVNFDPVLPPDHLQDVAAPAVRLSRSGLAQVQRISKKEGFLHIGIVDWRPPAPDADRIGRLELESGAPFLETAQMTYVAACMADKTKLRFIAQFDRDISEVMPYLNARIRGAVYSPRIPTLGFPLGQRMVTLYGTRLAVGKTDEIVDTWRTMAWVKDLINETWMKRASIEPCTDERERPQPLEIYKRLPRTNCRECGEPTCMAFAARLSRTEADLTQCPHMYREEYEGMRMALLSLFPTIQTEGEFEPSR